MSNNKSKRLVEADMGVRSYSEKDKLSHKIFSLYPILGEYTPTDATLNKWAEITRNYILEKQLKRSVNFNDWVYEVVSLMIIHYAQYWSSNEEGKFTKYVAMQLGFRDDSGRIWSLLTDALATAFYNNERLFIRRNGERQFYETVMVHSFGPYEAWEPLLDLLFDFYTNNLEWTYIEGDPLFNKLVKVLQAYFNDTKIDEDLYNIASQKYSMKIGIRRLVQYRPKYCTYLFERLVRRIHYIINNSAGEAKRYSDLLVDQWFAKKLSNSSIVTGKRYYSVQKTTDLALDYSRVNIRYVLCEGRIALKIPAIRILEDGQGPATALLYEEDRVICKYDLEIRGNELGETIRQKTIILPIESLSSSEILYRLIISRNGITIHDSEKKLWRTLVFFDEEREVPANKISKQKYEIFVPNYSKLKLKNIDTISLLSGMYEMSFHTDFCLEYAGNTIAIDTTDIQGVKIINPNSIDNVRFVSDGEEYYLVKKGSLLEVYFESWDEAKKYRVDINGNNSPLVGFYDCFAGNRSVIPIETEHEKITVSIIDIAAAKILFRENYYVITDFSYTFNKSIYVTAEEFDKLELNITYDDENHTFKASGREVIEIEYNEGVLLIAVPSIQYSYIGIDTIFFDKYIRADDITSESFLQISNPTGIAYSITIGEHELGDISKVSLLDHSSMNLVSGNGNTKDITLNVRNKKYIIGHIVFGCTFIHQPSITLRDNCLYWDGGISFIGNADAELYLVLMKDGKAKYYFDLKNGKQLIYDFCSEEFPDDQYGWFIYANGAQVSSGNSFIGNESKARFAGKTLQIDYVTEDIEKDSKPVQIKTVYIDQIEYKETSYVEKEGDVYDVYSGCMYWLDWYGQRHYYSFKDNDKKYKINPVKIIYINDRYLRIVNDDDDGILYFYNINSRTPGNEITDRNPPAKAKHYHDILFYLLDTSVINKTHATLKTHDIGGIEEAEIKRNILTHRADSNTKKEGIPQVSFNELKPVSQDVVIKASAEERILVNAGPGTGKTWALIEKIIHLVKSGTEPESIQVLCFSRAAVDVVRKRMGDAISSGRVEPIINLVDIRTFDSFATQLLYWVKDSEYDEIANDFHIEALDYDERINRVIKILKARPELIEQCEHLIVDEVQDLVLKRAELVLEMIRILPEACGITLFGDACQAIYDYQVDSGMNSDGFYNSIKKTGQFSYYSFEKNYRQTSYLHDYCNEYRKAILTGDLEKCNDNLAKLEDVLPDYNPVRLSNFTTGVLDKLLDDGNIGLLTRSNAQALYISGMFHRKGISHTLQRRLADNYLNGWIAVTFNSYSRHYYDEDVFASAISSLFPERYTKDDICDFWNAMISASNTTGNTFSVAELLQRIRDCGRSSSLFLDSPVNPVIISTIHRSKGREYDSVITLDNLITDKKDSMEEQRVNYVALSRAKNRIYKVEMPTVYFNTLEKRRCYTLKKNFQSGKLSLRYYEIGRPGDFSAKSFCTRHDVQEFLRKNISRIKDSEAYLVRNVSGNVDFVSYYLVLKENGMILGETSSKFAEDLEKVLRKIKNLPWHAPILDYVYPKRFNGIYIMDIASEIGMMQGDEIGITEYDSLITWNIVLAEGYARVEY